MPPLAGERLGAQVVAEERRAARHPELQLSVLDAKLDAGERLPHRPVTDLVAGQRAGQRSGLGLAVAVVDVEAELVAEGGDHPGVERLAGADQPSQRGHRPELGPLGEHPVLGRRLTEHVDALALADRQPLAGVEAALVQIGGRSRQPGCDERVPRRLRPARRRGAPGQLAGTGAEPAFRLEALPEQVALRVDRGLRRAGRSRGEDDQRRIAGVEVGRHRRGRLWALLVEDRGDLVEVHVVDALGELLEPALLAERQHRGGDRDPMGEVGASKLRVAGERDGADPKAGEHRQHPFGTVPDQGHDDVSAADAARLERPGEAGGAGVQLAEAPLPPCPGLLDRDHRDPCRREVAE